MKNLILLCHSFPHAFPHAFVYLYALSLYGVREGYPRSVMVNALDCGILVNVFESCHATAFTFGQISLGKVYTLLSSQL